MIKTKREKKRKTVQTLKQDRHFPPPDKIWQILGPNKLLLFQIHSHFLVLFTESLYDECTV